MRHAFYFSPSNGSPLALAGAAWLGRDAFTGNEIQQPRIQGYTREGLASVTRAPRRYGFHGTLKAPFRLNAEEELSDLKSEMRSFCEQQSSFNLQLKIGRLGSFFALVPAGDVTELRDLASSVVQRFEPFRAPLNADEFSRRRPETLNEAQRRYLETWGYPYIFDEFRFHMTLTGPVGEEEVPLLQNGLEAHFGDVIRHPVMVDALSLFEESEAGGPFVLTDQVKFTKGLR